MIPLQVSRSYNFLHETKSDFQNASTQNMAYMDEVQGLQITKKSNNDYVDEGILVSSIITTDFIFNNVILSWNADLPKETNITVDLQVRDNNFRWSPWHEMGAFGDIDSTYKYQIKTSWAGNVREDELRMKVQGTQLRYRVTLRTKDPLVTPTLRLIGVSYSDTKNKINVKDTKSVSTDSSQPLPNWVKDLNVPWRTQTILDRSIAGSACHPTSLSMVLEFYGTNLPTEKVADQVYDPYSDIFGNWPFNAAYAATLGYKAYVVRWENFDPVKKEIAEGHPVIISIGFGRDQLTNSPIHATGGHIIVIRGFTKDGDPICNDPAARTIEKGHVVYKKAELERAWINHSGAAVIIHPREIARTSAQ